jgi:opine dehydrogenase
LKERANMSKPVFAVMGAGNSGFGLAGDLALKGFETRLYELPEFAAAIEPLNKSDGIRVRGITGEGVGKLARLTTDVREAVNGADVVLVSIPAYGHRRMAEVLAPHVTDGQVVLVMPGNVGGALEFAHVIREAGNSSRVTIAEAASFIFACKKDGPDGVWIRGIKEGLPLAAIPAVETERVLELLAPAYPEFSGADNVLEVSLNNINHPIHPPALLLNVARIEQTGGGWSFFHEGMTPGVCSLMERLDDERVAICAAFGLPEVTVLEWTTKFYGPQGFGGETLYEALSTTPVHGASKAPASIDHRYFTEDVPYGLVPIASLGEAAGICTKVTGAVSTVAGAVVGHDFWAMGRTVETLGLAGMDREAILEYVSTGSK